MLLSSIRYRFFIPIACFILTLALLNPAASRAQSPERQLIESDAPRVIQVGTWSSQPATPASNGSYLFNDPSPVGAGRSPAQSDPHPAQDDPLLALAFMGSAIEIIYVSGPRFGTLAIEVDGTVLRTVITTTEKIEYGQVATINYLSDEPHTLKVYAQSGGIVAIDAFRITPISPSPVLERGPGGEVNVFDDGGIQSTPCSAAPTHAIHRVSVNADGQAANAEALHPSLSADGRYVAFSATASNLVIADNNFSSDIFVVDRLLCTVSLASVNSTGAQATTHSYGPSISADGRYVAFLSDAYNLVADDTNDMTDIFVHDRQTRQTTRVSVGSGGTQSNAASGEPIISANGRYVVFSSTATNLVSGDTNGELDVFVHDRQAGLTTRVSVATGGGQATGVNLTSGNASISSDGRYIAFRSYAANLVAGDTNNFADIFVHDRQEGQTTRISLGAGGAQTNSHSFRTDISDDGRYITYRSYAANLVPDDTNNQSDIFVYDRQTNTTTRVSVATGGTQAIGATDSDPRISADGRYVAFYSRATNLVSGDTNAFADAFVHDRQTNSTYRVSVSSSGVQANDDAYAMAISGDGRYVGLQSEATTLISGDTTTFYDVFVAPSIPPSGDALALFNPTYEQVNLLDTLADNPAPERFTAFSAYTPTTTAGQWVMGDWNGDGLKTPGVYLNGPFYYTNVIGESQPSDWRSLWIGIAGPPISGRFNASRPNDCIGAVQSANFPPFGTAFVFYFTCDLSTNPTPTIYSQWLSVILPDSGGFTGTHQFGAGDFDGDGLDSIAIRRGDLIAFGNVAPVGAVAAFDLAQYIGTPGTGDAGILVVGDWDGNRLDSFGLFYQTGELFYRNDLLFNSGAYANQSVGTPFGSSGVQAATWR